MLGKTYITAADACVLHLNQDIIQGVVQCWYRSVLKGEFIPLLKNKRWILALLSMREVSSCLQAQDVNADVTRWRRMEGQAVWGRIA